MVVLGVWAVLNERGTPVASCVLHAKAFCCVRGAAVEREGNIAIDFHLQMSICSRGVGGSGLNTHRIPPFSASFRQYRVTSLIRNNPLP